MNHVHCLQSARLHLLEFFIPRVVITDGNRDMVEIESFRKSLQVRGRMRNQHTENLCPGLCFVIVQDSDDGTGLGCKQSVHDHFTVSSCAPNDHPAFILFHPWSHARSCILTTPPSPYTPVPRSNRGIVRQRILASSQTEYRSM